MIRNWLHLVLVYRLSSFLGECSTRRNNPIVSSLGTATSGPDFDTAGVDTLLSFATREVSLGVDSTLRCQVLALLTGVRITDNHQLGVRFML